MKRKAFRPKKRFGQNFLYDPAIAGKILAAAELAPGQPVIELGPGKGILTRPLVASGARLIALELDIGLHGSLSNELAEAIDGGEVEILNMDFTKISLAGLLAERGLERCVLIGNIPYHLTREVLFSFLVDEFKMLDGAYLMVQREVGERIVSPPGNRTYGIPSVILQSLYDVRSLFKVLPGSFHPRPRVSSIVLEFKPLAEPLIGSGEIESFSHLVKSVFQQRRKTLLKTIRVTYAANDEALSEVERISGIDLGKRPEALSKEEFLRLWRTVNEVVTS